jgi:Putative auto-transporter adhesin, head GIN domain
MFRPLGWTAIVGLSVGVVFLSLAYATGGSPLWRMVDLGLSSVGSCDANGATASERRFKWDGDDTVDIAGSAIVHYRGGEGDEVIVRGSPDVVANVEVQGGRITINCRGTGSRTADITLPGRVFRKMHLSGSGKVLLENVNQPDLVLAISGSGSLRAQGSVDRLTVSITGSGGANLADLALKQLTVKVAGSGNIEAAPKDVADITTSGTGNVRLLTRPAQLRSHVSGSGRITQAPLEAADGKK